MTGRACRLEDRGISNFTCKRDGEPGKGVSPENQRWASKQLVRRDWDRPMRRVGFPAGIAEIPDVDDLNVDDLKKLVFRDRDENAGLAAEIARLKWLKGRSKIGASGMEPATDAPAKGGTAKTRRRLGRQAGGDHRGAANPSSHRFKQITWVHIVMKIFEGKSLAILFVWN